MVRNRIPVKAPGSKILISDNIEGVVLQVNILMGGAVQYLISWWDSGEIKKEWLYEEEIKNSKKEDETKEIIITELYDS